MPQYEMNLSDYVRIIRKRLWIILTAFIILFGSAWFWSWRQPDIYQAIATVRVSESPSMVMGYASWAYGDPMESEVRVITGRKVMERAAITLGWVGKALREMADEGGWGAIDEKMVDKWKVREVVSLTAEKFGLDEEDSRKLDERLNLAVNRLRGSVSAIRMERTSIIRITGSSLTPLEAAGMANMVAKAYRDVDYQSKNEQILDLLSQVEGEFVRAEKGLREVGKELESFKRKHELSDLRGQIAAKLQIVTKIELQRDDLRRQRADIEKVVARAKNEPDKLEIILAESAVVDKVPAVPPLKREISNLKVQLSMLLKKFTELHPEVRKTEKKILSTQEQIAKELESRIEALKGEETSLEEKLAKYRQEFESLAAIEEEHTTLSRNRREAEMVRAELLAKQKEVKFAVAETFYAVSMVNPASVPASPARPNRPLQRMVGAIAGLMLGFAFAFLREHIDTSIGTIEDVESYIKMPVLGVIPYLKHEREKSDPSAKFSNIKGLIPYLKHKAEKIRTLRRHKPSHREKISTMKAQLVTRFSPKSTLTEAYRTLRTNIQFAGLEKGGKTILITSAGPGEGKSITSSNLAITMAQAGKRTLLVSADLRKPVIHKIFGLNREPGLTNVLVGAVKLEEVLKTLTDILLGTKEWEEALKVPGLDNLNILTSGYLPPNPSEILNLPEMDSLLEQLKTRFDLIIFDSPPVLPVTDAAILGAKVDSAVLVYQVGKAARSALSRAKVQLENVGTKVKGVILNHLRPEIAPYTTYYYHYRYYGGTEEKEKETPKV